MNKNKKQKKPEKCKHKTMEILTENDRWGNGSSRITDYFCSDCGKDFTKYDKSI